MKISIILLLPFLLFPGCNGDADESTKQARAIIQLPADQRGKVLAGLPMEKQLDVYLYAATRVEPPIILAQELAKNDPRSLLPSVKTRLATENNDRRLTQLMLILAAVSTNTCSLEKRTDILDLIQRTIANMKDDRNRETDKHILDVITHPEQQLPSCPS